jgi:CelD/BcsL family acetyltransferase involved in cellulose biosynthesis/RimJ/RimL family protein N-acetyltransferase
MVTTTPALGLTIHRGDGAFALLDDREFRRAWRGLHATCPWATAFQDAPFADTWYRAYESRFEPVLVEGRTDATLTGLLLLASSRAGRTLCHVGAEHAEYQTWLSTDDRFAVAALDALAAAFPRRRLQLLFVPPGVPFVPGERWRSRCFRRPFVAPLLATSPADAVRESMRKKANRSKLNRLTRRGKLAFERVADDAAFEALLDQLIPLYELRQGAAHDALPFRQDPLKRSFYLALQRRTDLLHVTALRLDDELIAAHVGFRSRNTVLVGMPVQSPRYARHSVGKLLFYELALLLEREGFEALDLTPGGDYKDRFATRFEEASVLTVVFSRPGAWRHRHGRRLIDAAKRRGLSTERVKRAMRAVRHTAAHLQPATLPFTLASRLRRAVWGDVELRVYRHPGGAPATHPEPVPMARDRFADLACYVPAERWQPTTGAFLQSATERLENGEHCYTRVEDGVLAHCGWLVDRQETTFMDEVHQPWTLPPGSAVAYGFYTHPRFRGRGMYASSLGRILRDAAAIPGLGDVYICVRADNTPSRRVIERLGFVYDRSFHERRRLRRVRRWSSGAIGRVSSAGTAAAEVAHAGDLPAD